MNLKKQVLILLLLLIPTKSFAALSATGLWEINAGSVASNAGGGGFNPANAGMLTDLTTDANTANTSAPVVSSASYNFVAGDAGNWLYIKSGTDWTPGWYKIASVAANKATLSAAVGSASVVQITNQVTGTAHGKYGTNTVIGCATVGTPTSGTFTIDYSQSTTSVISGVADFTAVGSSTTLTSATAGFTPVMVGNYYHQTTTGTGGFGLIGWYEIATYVDSTNVTLDRTPNNGTASVACTGYVGGALSFNSTLDDDVLEASVAGQRWFVKNNGTITTGEAIAVAAAGTDPAKLALIGYNATRGDAPTGTSRPTFSNTVSSFQFNTIWHIENIIVTGTTTNVSQGSTNGHWLNCKFINTSTTADRIAFTASSGVHLVNCEAVSLRGIAVDTSQTALRVFNCYAHNSDIGIRSTGTGATPVLIGNIIEENVTAGLQLTGATTTPKTIYGNTFYGSENKLGLGISVVTGGTIASLLYNNIFYGFVTAISAVDTLSSGFGDYNDFFNNTNDVTSNNVWQKGPNDLAVNPTFTNVTQVTGTGASSSTNVLTDTGKNFTTLGVTTDDFCYISAGTGTGIALEMYQITAVGTTTLTLSSNITSSGSGSSITYQITLGHNFNVGTNLKALGFPGAFQNGDTTGYTDIGAVQRQEAGGGASSYTFS